MLYEVITQTITIDDITPPTADPLPALTFECIQDVPQALITDVTNVADNCDPDPVVAFVSA